MPVFNAEQMSIEITESGQVRVRREGGDRFLEYKNVAEVLMERPHWLNAQSRERLLRLDERPEADNLRFFGERPEEMSRQAYRSLSRDFPIQTVFDDESRAVAVRGATLAIVRSPNKESTLLALPAMLASSTQTQLVAIETSANGMPVLQARYATLKDAVAKLPERVATHAEMKFSALQVQHAVSFGPMQSLDQGEMHWNAQRIAMPVAGLNVKFDGRHTASTEIARDLFLHEFKITPTEQNGNADIARIIGGKIDGDRILETRSTLALNKENIELAQTATMNAIESKRVAFLDAVQVDQQQRVARIPVAPLLGRSLERQLSRTV